MGSVNQVTAERDTLVADLRQRQAGQKSAEEQLAHVRKENAVLKEYVKQQAIDNQNMAHNLKHATEAYNTLQPLKNENAAMRALPERATNDDSPLLAVIVPNAESIAALALLQEMRNLLVKQ